MENNECSGALLRFGFEIDTEYHDISRESLLLETNGSMDVVYPSDNELQIDIDSEEDLNEFGRMFHSFKGNLIGFEKCKIVSAESKSGTPHYHITVTLPEPIDNLTRILFQALLGSDRMREFLSLVRLWSGDDHPTLFLEQKKELPRG